MIPGLTLRAFKQRENASRMLRSRRWEIGSGEREQDASKPKVGNRFGRIVSARSYAEGKFPGLGAKRARSRSSTSKGSNAGKKKEQKSPSSLQV